MASLYIKDSETAALASELAIRLGVTKTEIVRDALRRRMHEIGGETRELTFKEKLDAWRKEHPLPPPTGLKADKAFFDALWGED